MSKHHATPSNVDEAVACLAAAFAQDPITGFLLESGTSYQERLTQFFSLLMRARIALKMPVILARQRGVQGAAMGYSTDPSDWPADLANEWDRFENSVPGLPERMAIYDEIASRAQPQEPHYYLGVIGVDPDLHGRGIGRQLLKSFCDMSASDPKSRGVYLETANATNLTFYKSAGFVETGQGNLGGATLWCMYLPHGHEDTHPGR